MNAIKAEMALFDSTGKRGSCLETVCSNFHQHRWKLKENFPRREFSQLNCDHDLVIIQSTLWFPALLLSSRLELSLNVTKPLGSPECCTDYSQFDSGLILLVNWGTFNFELIKFIKTTENTISA